jgi:hypothetical protein
VLISHCVTICTAERCHDIAYTYVNIRSAPTVQCVRLLFVVITVNECCTAVLYLHTVMVLLTVPWAMAGKHCYCWGKMRLMVIL